MSKFEHRGYEIEMNEGVGYREHKPESGRSFDVRSRKLTYHAASDLGDAFASTPQQALDDAKDLIDRVLEEGV